MQLEVRGSCPEPAAGLYVPARICQTKPVWQMNLSSTEGWQLSGSGESGQRQAQARRWAKACGTDNQDRRSS